jgi:YidC/Oxa1 family membrane protein insertase
MLWSAVELRHESLPLGSPTSRCPTPSTSFPFLGLASIPIHPLPILMGISSFIQIAITPKTGDKTQQMIFMFMPLIFIFICYNFRLGACALLDYFERLFHPPDLVDE